ncbi:hypothetical protein P691DRAFT_802855 [Macrolepiota fuliginosa MF-IS2]|uniref:Uncharacterized protein n=1 Tax=Macrolepiota fuliginosa MF-IS2 TaxID=1400762 RepID=A0A9P6C3E6_9AGAR|nr:hypothetical protein P691DRAFT_802855 [Macrolepiota fuliginosa MF-IS2]
MSFIFSSLRRSLIVVVVMVTSYIGVAHANAKSRTRRSTPSAIPLIPINTIFNHENIKEYAFSIMCKSPNGPPRAV